MSSSDKYTDPELREEVKEQMKAGDKGGAPGQWSARKAQMMASEYKKRGGGYTTDKETGQDESQKHLSEWGEEEWQTKEGSGNAKQDDGTEKRYLPKKAWEQMTEEEKEATERKKEEGSKEGKQYVENTDEAKDARKNAQNANKEDEEEKDGANGSATSHKNGVDKLAQGNGDHKIEEKNGDEDLEEKEDDAEGEYEEEVEEQDDDGDEEEEQKVDTDANGEGEAKTGQKRSRSTKSSGSSKKQKSANGKAQKSNEPPALPGSADRLPKKGQGVSWHFIGGYVHGTVLEIVSEEKDVEGHKVKGAEGDPRIVLKTDNGKVAVHKPEALFFDDEE